MERARTGDLAGVQAALKNNAGQSCHDFARKRKDAAVVQKLLAGDDRQQPPLNTPEAKPEQSSVREDPSGANE